MGYTGERKRQYDNAWRIARRERAIRMLGGCCIKCGSTEQLEFDHINPATKDPKLKDETRHSFIWTWAWAWIVTELAKCQLLCHNCHKSKTISELRGPEHGTASAYLNRKCHCDVCKEWMKLYKRDYRARKAATRETADPPVLGTG